MSSSTERSIAKPEGRLQNLSQEQRLRIKNDNDKPQPQQAEKPEPNATSAPALYVNNWFEEDEVLFSGDESEDDTPAPSITQKGTATLTSFLSTNVKPPSTSASSASTSNKDDDSDNDSNWKKLRISSTYELSTSSDTLKPSSKTEKENSKTGENSLGVFDFSNWDLGDLCDVSWRRSLSSLENFNSNRKSRSKYSQSSSHNQRRKEE